MCVESLTLLLNQMLRRVSSSRLHLEISLLLLRILVLSRILSKNSLGFLESFVRDVTVLALAT